ncbi:MAG: DUF4189 domain-containing protein [Pseudomonadota bacterium]
MTQRTKNAVIFFSAAALLVLTLAGPADAQRRQYFGAIALSPSTGAIGWAFDHPSQVSAENQALRGCYNYAGDCRVGTWFRNACGAVAIGNGGGWGAAWGGSRRAAENAAINACNRNTNRCTVRRWVCTAR